MEERRKEEIRKEKRKKKKLTDGFSSQTLRMIWFIFVKEHERMLIFFVMLFRSGSVAGN